MTTTDRETRLDLDALERDVRDAPEYGFAIIATDKALALIALARKAQRDN
jgi:hypothetical protein